MDVSFGEDANRKRNKNATQNFFIVFKTALAMLKEYQARSIAAKRKSAGWSNKVLMDILKT